MPPTFATQHAADEPRRNDCFLQGWVETYVRQRNNSAGARKCFCKIFLPVFLNGDHVDVNGIALDEDPREVSSECGREATSAARLLKKILNCIGS